MLRASGRTATGTSKKCNRSRSLASLCIDVPQNVFVSAPSRDPNVLARSFYPRWLMGYDRLGRPILVTRYGSLRLWDMSKLTSLERMTELHIREQELLLRLLRRRTAEGGVGGAGNGVGKEEEKQGEGSADNLACIVDTAVVIIDTAGLTLRHVRGDRWWVAQWRSSKRSRL